MLGDDIAKQIKLWRMELGWSQQKLAKKAGVSTQTIVNIENEHFYPRHETLQKIKRALDID